jgi:hypothetical protein
MSSEDLSHLRLLGIFHYVLGGMAALISFIWLIYVALGVLIISSPEIMTKGHEAPPPEVVGWMLTAFGAVAIFAVWTVAVLLFMAGRNLSRQVHYTYCLVIAAISCLFMPLGTVLGIFTLVVLTRSGVKEMFDVAPGKTRIEAPVS